MTTGEELGETGSRSGCSPSFSFPTYPCCPSLLPIQPRRFQAALDLHLFEGMGSRLPPHKAYRAPAGRARCGPGSSRRHRFRASAGLLVLFTLPARNHLASRSCRTKARVGHRAVIDYSSLCPAWSGPSCLPCPLAPWGQSKWYKSHHYWL